jgi:hypothetical protein
MDWGNCIIRAVHKDGAGTITALDGELHLQGDFKKTKLKLTWLADVPDVVPLRLVDFGHLITKPKVWPLGPRHSDLVSCCNRHAGRVSYRALLLLLHMRLFPG